MRSGSMGTPSRLKISSHLAVHRARVDPAAGAQRLAPDEDVLGHRQVREQRRFLVDDGDALVGRVAGAGEEDGLAVDGEQPGVGLVHAGEDLDQCGLAGSVLTHERMGLAGI